jgi:ssRNA-specific RNase YbeY (16S rRNA maturation enzyme)
MSKILNTILFLILFGLIAYLGYNLYQYIPGEDQSFSININKNLPETNASASLIQFVPNMRFAKTNLVYYIFPGCSEEKISRMNQAFNIISQETGIISFTKINTYTPSEIDITIYCTELQKQVEKNKFIAGEGGPDAYLNLSLYPLIITGEIYLYDTLYQEKCAYPIVELHELLHVFGFDHISKKTSILYPYSSCNQQLDGEVVSELKRLYSIPANSELSFTDLKASKNGIYMDFNASINNQGLITAENVLLILSSEGKEFQNFSMEDLESGSTKTLGIQNLILPRKSTSEITFKIISSTPEYSLENNEVIAKI